MCTKESKAQATCSIFQIQIRQHQYKTSHMKSEGPQVESQGVGTIFVLKLIT
jgi:hypothetical protein